MPITLNCGPYGHEFATKAARGNTVGCPVCRRDLGRRTSVRVPLGVGRRTSAVPGADGKQRQGAEGQGDGGHLAAAWAREAPAAYDWRHMPMHPAEGEACGECGGAVLWHSAHTALVCLACSGVTDSPGVTRRAEAHAEALARRKARAAGTAPAIEADPHAEARARATRVELHRNRETLEGYAGQMLAMCDGDAYERSQFARLAFQIGATTRGYLTEIRQAPDTATLHGIFRELKDIREGDEYRSLADEAREQNERMDRAERAAELAAEYDEEPDDDGAYEDRQGGGQALATPGSIAAQQHRAQFPAWSWDAYDRQEQDRARAAEVQRIAVRPSPRQLPAASPPSAAIMIAAYARQRAMQKTARENAIATQGACGFCRKPVPATRIYGNFTYYQTWGFGSDNNTVLDEKAPHIRACPKHYPNAWEWITRNGTGEQHHYRELVTA